MTTTAHSSHVARAADWYSWRPSTARRCPLALAGRRCRLGVTRTCLCASQVLDHLRRWTDHDGRPVLTAEPYAVDGANIATLDAIGLRLELTGRSPYLPGARLLLTIRPGAS